jgi:hypothetical protein
LSHKLISHRLVWKLNSLVIVVRRA